MPKVTDNFYVLVLMGMTGITVLVGAMVYFILKYQRNMFRQQVQMQQAALTYQKKILHATIASQEEERKRIGSDLHDEVCGALANLQLMTVRVPDPAVIHQEFDRVIDRVRTISHRLSPPCLVLFGLHEALEELCDGFRQVALPDIRVGNQAGEQVSAWPLSVTLPLYRIVQELLSNTMKHAGASSVSMILDQEASGLSLSYTDNGRGLSSDFRQKKGMGMNNVISRIEMIGATYTMQLPGEPGFSIIIHIPDRSLQKEETQ